MAGASLPNPTFRSAILRLPVHLRTPALNKLSANANAHGGAKKHTKGRIQGVAAQRLRSALGIYLIEVNPTGPLAASVGGASPASITIEGGTPASAAIAANELDPVTWAAPGPKSLTVQVGTELAGNTKVTV
jgi:hypothetical protein